MVAQHAGKKASSKSEVRLTPREKREALLPQPGLPTWRWHSGPAGWRKAFAKSDIMCDGVLSADR